MTIYSIRTKILLLTIMLMVNFRCVLADTFVGQVFYEQTYEAPDGTSIGADWTTSVNGRFTPTILEDGGNHYLSVVNTTRNNNGCVLTNTSLAGKVAANTDFVMTFDLKVSSSNNQSPTSFTINDAANTGTIFSLTATGTYATTWILNSGTTYTLPNTNKSGGLETIDDVPWYSVKIKRVGTDTYVTITPKAGGDAIVSNASVTASGTGGLGNMTFTTRRYNANFAIDNIRVTSLFSFSSNEAAIDITSIGMNDRPDVSSQLPSLINEVGASGFSYSSSDWNVARVDNDGHVYLVGVGTATIGIAGTNTDTYTSSYELTVYGSTATVTKTVTNSAGTTTATWFMNDNAGLVEQRYDFGVVTLSTAFGAETAISVKDATNHYVVRVVDANGYTHTNIDGGTLHEDSYGGTFYRIDLTQTGKLQIWGTGGNNAILLNALTTSSTIGASSTDAGTGNSTWNSLSAGTYYLYNTSLHSITYTYTTPKIAWSDNLATVNINDVGITNPNIVTGLPTLTEGTVDTDYDGNDKGDYVTWTDGYGYPTAQAGVAKIQGSGVVHIIGTGETILKAKAVGGTTEDYIAAYKLIVTGNTVDHTITGGNTLSFDDVGVISTIGVNGNGQKVANLTNLTVTYGYTGETSIVTTCNDMTVLKVIDADGYSQPNLWYNEGTPPVIPLETAKGGTFIKLTTSANGYLIVTGNVSEERTVIYKWNTDRTDGILLTAANSGLTITENTLSASLESGATYYLYNKMLPTDDASDIYIPLVHSISFVPGFFSNAYETVRYEDVASYTLQVPKGLVDPLYEVVGTKGDVSDGEHAIGIDGSNHLTNVAGGGAIRIRATKDAKSLDYILTVAYPATYPGKIWNFNDGTSIHTITDAPTPTTTSGDWTARYKNANNERDARWFYKNAVAGDNAFVVEKTAGLIFETAANGFYMRNDDNLWRHVGIFRYKASFTIPLLKAGDVVELNWKRDAEASGATFTATNVTDLRGKTVSEPFIITGSRNRDARDLGGWTSFIVIADGDVKFTLEDNGYNDLLSVRIYSGGYRPTMDQINQYDGNTGVPAPTTILLDNAEQSVTLNYNNPLHGTSTGPAMYVLKGYRSGVDNPESVTGKDSQKPGNTHVDEDGYPVSSDEQSRLYNLRKSLTGFHMYNQSWESANNTYNNGVIKASGGYGKVTVRLNNYTQDMKYVIGYTPDYTITFGSKPHQDYPYTWNFTNISGGAVKDKTNNAYNNISSDPYTWTGLGYETYQLDTRTSGGSLYVEGATLVTADRDLGRKGTIAELNAASLGCDEFNGLGFAGQIAFKAAQQGTEANDAPTGGWDRGVANQLLLYDFKYAASSSADNDYTAQHSTGSWVSAELQAGDGKITFGSPGKRETPAGGITLSYTSANFVYKMDGGNTKNALLKPQRPFQEGDVITLHGYSTANVQQSGFSFYAGANDNAYDALLTLNWSSSTATAEQEIKYTVKQGDGLAGRAEVYLCRAGKQYTVYLTEVQIIGDDASAPTSYERAITCNGDVTVTIPDLLVNHYVYIKSSEEPNSVTSNLTKILVSDDGTDGYDVATYVYKYKVNEAGNADVTFASGTKIYRIGVTNIMKQLKRVGEGDVWATESRNHAIDYTQTGQFTVNDIKANTVTAKSYTGNKVTVRLNEKTAAMPAETGMVLKMKMKYSEGDDDGNGGTMTAEQASTATTNAVANFAKAKGGNQVPLFYPPYSTTILNSSVVVFDGTEGNLMMANLDSRELTQERETGVIDKDGDAVDDSGAADGDFTRFIFADRYMKWTKIDNDVQHTTGFTESGNVPVFYRMHLYTTAEATALSTTADELNTLGANKAYMLIRSGNVPDALWKTGGGSAKRFIGIEGVSDMEEIIEAPNTSEALNNDAIYSLSGQLMGYDESLLAPGIYIRNGKKFLVR